MKLTRGCGFEIKAAAEDKTFSGYGSVFGNADCYNDIVEKGAFAKTIEKIDKSGQWPAMLLQHGGFFEEHLTPVGVWTKIEENDHGLYVEGKLADTPRGNELYALLKMQPRPAITGLSIGFYCTDSYDEKKDDTFFRHITGVDLLEISLVTFPANEQARIKDVKSEGITIRDAERALREAGFSRNDAKLILAKGYKGFLPCDAEKEERENNEIAAILRRSIACFKGE